MKPVSCSRIISNLHNVARNAAIAASAQRASDDVRRVSRSKRGSGNAMVAGLYTGAHDSTIDVEVVDVSSGALQASAPVVSGVGSGTLTVGAVAAGSAAETITLTLLDAGTPDKAATFDFFGHEIAAAVAGPAGNAIALTVTRNLTHTKVGAVLDTIAAGTIDLVGQGWDFGQPSGDGQTVPSDALRLRFAGHPTVHRSWRTWDGGAWVYHIDPAVPYEVLSDTVAEAVTGDYEISVSNGVTTETYRAITVYDFLRELRARSALLEVRAAVVNDRTAGGMATVEIPLRTDAYALPAQIKTKVDTRIALGAVRAGNPTENVIVKHLGKDAWSVRGAATGEWPAARTGEGYTAGPVGFTILRKTEIAQSLAARITGKYTPTSRTDADPGLPAICFKPLVLGAKATDKTITFTWTKRPPAECFCDNLPALRLSAECLGLDIGGAEMALDAEHQSRLVALYAWYAEFTGSNTGIDTIPSAALMTTLDSHAATKRMIADPEALRLADAAVAEFYEGLEDVYASLDGRTQWDAYFAALDTLLSDVEGLASDDDIANFTRFEDHASGIHGHVSSLSVRIPGIGAAIGFFKQRWAAQMDHCRVISGVLPKQSAGSDAGACWRDVGDPFYWADNDGFYLPVFNNVPYVSAIKTADGEIVSTQEFGFGVVTQCEHRLKEGDTITITISGTANSAEYGDDDEIIIPVVSAGAARLAGGEDGDATQVWTVRGTASGPLPDWLYDPGAPADYTHGPAPLTLKPGGIPFAVGDRISFSVAGGTLRWRRDGGAWTTAAIYGPPQDIGDGLTLTAQGGSAPAFVEGDRWQYRARATFGPDRLRTPMPDESFAWDGDALMLDADLGAVVDIEAVALWALQLADAAVVTLSGGAAAAGEWSVTPVRTPDGVLLAPLGGLHAVRYLRVTVTGAGAEGGALGWLWAGQGWQPTVGASSLTLRRRYALARGDSLNPGALYRGRGTGGTWSWSITDGGAVFDAEMRGLLALLDHVALNGLEPVLLVPSLKEPQLASMAILDADDIDMDDVLNWQGGGVERAVSVDLAFRGVM